MRGLWFTPWSAIEGLCLTWVALSCGCGTAEESMNTGDPFADAVVSFSPGMGAGFGGQMLPAIVLGPPKGAGMNSGSLDVLTLGKGGAIVLRFDDLGLIDGPGPDLMVFENPFPGNEETGVVGVSEDGVNFVEWPCATDKPESKYPGCAGVVPVLSNPNNFLAATDPQKAGGDVFDLATIGVKSARYVRIRDSGRNFNYAAPTGGFDLDAVAVVNGQRLEQSPP